MYICIKYYRHLLHVYIFAEGIAWKRLLASKSSMSIVTGLTSLFVLAATKKSKFQMKFLLQEILLPLGCRLKYKIEISG